MRQLSFRQDELSDQKSNGNFRSISNDLMKACRSLVAIKKELRKLEIPSPLAEETGLGFNIEDVTGTSTPAGSPVRE